jgi:chemotaxis protein methyltransferase CheR
MDEIDKETAAAMHAAEMTEALDELRLEKSALLKELRHRVSNNLQLMTSIVRLELSASTEASARRALMDTERRLHALSITNGQFLNRQDAGKFELYSFMHDLASDFHSIYDPDSRAMSVSLSGQRTYLPMSAIAPLGIITGEIVSHTLDRARARAQRSRLDISWEEDEGGMLALSYCDTSGGLAEENLHNWGDSLGMIIIQALAEQMRARVSVANSSMGAMITIEFPS